MKFFLELILLIVAAVCFLADASPKVVSAWGLSAIGWFFVTVVLALLFLAPAF